MKYKDIEDIDNNGDVHGFFRAVYHSTGTYKAGEIMREGTYHHGKEIGLWVFNDFGFDSLGYSSYRYKNKIYFII